MTPYIKRSDRLEDIQLLNRYVQSGGNGTDMSVWRYKRLMMWLNGYSYREIGMMERPAVTKQAVFETVKKDYATIKSFALSNH